MHPRYEYSSVSPSPSRIVVGVPLSALLMTDHVLHTEAVSSLSDYRSIHSLGAGMIHYSSSGRLIRPQFCNTAFMNVLFFLQTSGEIISAEKSCVKCFAPT